MFHVGQLVVCVDDANQGPRVEPHEMIHRGTVYEIRWAGAFVHPLTGPDGDCVRVVGIERWDGQPPVWPMIDAPFGAERFRPVDETRLDVFRKLLEPLPAERQIAEAVADLVEMSNLLEETRRAGRGGRGR